MENKSKKNATPIIKHCRVAFFTEIKIWLSTLYDHGKIIKLVSNHQLFKSLPEYTLSSTRGTAQKTVGFSSPISSISNLTSYSNCVNDGYITNPEFNYHIKSPFCNDRYTTYTHPTPETYWSTMPYECFLNDPIKDMCKRKVWYVHILLSQLQRRKEEGDYESQRKDSYAFSILKRKMKLYIHVFLSIEQELWKKTTYSFIDTLQQSLNPG